MKQFEFLARNGARLEAEYIIDKGTLHVVYRGISMSVAAGVNEMANAFLRDNLMRSITGELGTNLHQGTDGTASLSPSGAP